MRATPRSSLRCALGRTDPAAPWHDPPARPYGTLWPHPRAPARGRPLGRSASAPMETPRSIQEGRGRPRERIAELHNCGIRNRSAPASCVGAHPFGFAQGRPTCVPYAARDRRLTACGGQTHRSAPTQAPPFAGPAARGRPLGRSASAPMETPRSMEHRHGRPRERITELHNCGILSARLRTRQTLPRRRGLRQLRLRH